MRNEVLLLNADATPVSWLPLSSITWQNAVRLIWLDLIEVLHTYDGWSVHSPSMTIAVPAVVMLRKKVRGFRHWVARQESPQSHLVFLRDNFTCQYCNKQFSCKDLTIDHVMPRYYGGKTRYDNVVAACSPCNGDRGCDYNILPMTKPYLPTMGQLIKNMRSFPIVLPHESWNYYLKWDESLVTINIKRSKSMNDKYFDIDINHQIDCARF